MATSSSIRTLIPEPVGDVVFSADNSVLYVALGDTLRSYSVATGDILNSWSAGTDLSGLSVTPDGKYLVAIDDVNSSLDGPPVNGFDSYLIPVFVVDLTSGILGSSVLTSPRLPGNVATSASRFVNSMALTDDRILLTTNGSSGTTTLLDLPTGTFSSFGQGTVLNGLVRLGAPALAESSADGTYVVGHRGPQMILVDAAGTIHAEVTAVAEQAVVANGGWRIASFSRSNGVPEITVRDTSLAPVGAFAGDLQVNGMTFSPDGSTLYALDRATSTIYNLSASNGAVLTTLSLDIAVSPPSYASFDRDLTAASLINRLQISADGRQLAVIGDDKLIVADLGAMIIEAGYRQYFGRTPLAGEVDFWIGRLDAGANAAEIRNAILDDIVGREVFVDKVTEHYRDYLGRAPNPVELEFWNGLLRQGQDYGSVRLAIIRDAGGAAHLNETISTTYLELRGYGPSDIEAGYWVNAITLGQTINDLREALIETDQAVIARVSAQISAAYQLLALRNPTTQETNAWIEHFGDGADVDTLTSEILSQSANTNPAIQHYSGTSAADHFTLDTSHTYSVIKRVDAGKRSVVERQRVEQRVESSDH